MLERPTVEFLVSFVDQMALRGAIRPDEFGDVYNVYTSLMEESERLGEERDREETLDNAMIDRVRESEEQVEMEFELSNPMGDPGTTVYHPDTNVTAPENFITIG